MRQHETPWDITRHYKTLWDTMRHYATPSDIMRHHQTLWDTQISPIFTLMFITHRSRRAATLLLLIDTFRRVNNVEASGLTVLWFYSTVQAACPWWTTRHPFGSKFTQCHWSWCHTVVSMYITCSCIAYFVDRTWHHDIWLTNLLGSLSTTLTSMEGRWEPLLC